MENQLKEWRKRWEQGDTTFVPELLKKAEQYEMDLKGIVLVSSELHDMSKSALRKDQ